MRTLRDMPLGLRLVTAAIAAVMVAAVVSVAFLFASGSAGDGGEAGGGSAERIIEQLLTAGQGTDTDIAIRLGGLPDDYPREMPRFDGGRIIATVRSLSPGGLAFIALYGTDKRPGDALAFFERALSGRDWEVTSSSRSEDSAGLQFRQTSGNLEGVVSIARFGRAAVSAKEGDPYQVAVSVVDRSKGEAAPDDSDRPFDAAKSQQPVPSGFPADRVPLYKGATVIGSAFLKQEQGISYAVQLVTPDAQEDVIRFYQAELARSGWSVNRPFPSASSIELSFSDPASAASSGTVTAAVFLRETRLTEVNLRLMVGSGPPPGQRTPGATPTSTPRGGP